jgi:hypothetical protein
MEPGQYPARIGDPFPHRSTILPELVRRNGRPRRSVPIIVGTESLLGGTQVAPFRFQPAKPHPHAWAVALGIGLFGEGQEVRGMDLVRRVVLGAFVQLLQRVLADRLQHGEAGFTIRSGLVPQQALLAQPLHPTEGVERAVMVPNGLGRLQRATTREDGQTAKQDLLVGLEQIVRPGNRVAQGLLAGASRAPPVRKGSRCSNRASIACGGSSRTRAAASSMASGSPSSRQQISATAGAFALSTAKSGLTARARSMKSRTASYWISCSGVGGGSRRGRVRGGTGYSRSARKRRGTRLVASTVTRGAEPRRDQTAGPPSTRCSKLSRTRSRSRVARKSCSRPARECSPSSRRPKAVAMAEGTRAGSAIAASGTKQTPSAKSSSTSAAA